MIIVLLVVLSAVQTNGLSEDQHDPRRTKQLDLQDIQAPEPRELVVPLSTSNQTDDIINGSLPPFSSLMSPQNTVSAQSQQIFDFISLDSVEKERELCKLPFDYVLCNRSSGFYSELKIPKPSRDLVPPLPHLEQETSVTLNQKEEIIMTEKIQSEFKTTTAKVMTKISEQVITPAALTNLTSKIATTATKKAFPSIAEATNELRTYLPQQSEFSTAAQTNVAVVQPVSQKNNDHHDHHHDHHHRENFNICADAFHSFLCAPLKARKRITGAFPNSLKGQSSFVNYQKFLPNFEREPASSSTFQKANLPPKPVFVLASLTQSTQLPLLTTSSPVSIRKNIIASYSSPRVISKPSDTSNKFYLPPLTDKKIAPASSNQPFATIKPSLTSRPTVISTPRKITTSTPVHLSPKQVPLLLNNETSFQSVFNSMNLNENKFYLPPSPNPQSSASFISTSRNIYPITSTSPRPSLLGSSFSSNTIFTQKPESQFVFSGLNATAKPFMAQEKLQPVTFVAETTSASFIQESNQLQSSNPASYPYPKLLNSTKKPNSSFNLTEESSNEDKLYLPPNLKEQAAAQLITATVVPPQVKNPFHHGRDLCTDPFHSFLCASAKPRKRITGQLPTGIRPESSNTDQSRLSPESSNQDENKVRPEKPLESTLALGYKYPKPINPLSTPSNVIPSSHVPSSTGYSYPKPDKLFQLPLQQNVKLTNFVTIKPEPSEAKVVTGYLYPKPEQPYPFTAKPTKVNTTQSPLITKYSFPKPFPLPSDQIKVQQNPKQDLTNSDFTSSTNQVKGSQHPKAEESLKLPERDTEYFYPKPTKRLELPLESRAKFSLGQTNFNLDPLGAVGSADFVPVNKLDFKRSESKLVAGLRRFGERQKKRQKAAQIIKKHTQ